MAFVNRKPLAPTKGDPLRGLLGGVASGKAANLTFYLNTSDYMRRLLFEGRPQRAGIERRINTLHREMASSVVYYAKEEYERARRKRPNKGRDARRPARKMERALEQFTSGRGVLFGSPSGGGSINHTGFVVDFEKLDRVVTNRGFPYWRSLEYGYASFMAKRPMFDSSPGLGGVKSFPTRFKALQTDPRMPQGVGPRRIGMQDYNMVRISPFEGYGFIRAAIREVAVGPRAFRQVYSRDVMDLLPPEWQDAAEFITGGGKVLPGGRRRAPGGRFAPRDPRQF